MATQTRTPYKSPHQEQQDLVNALKTPDNKTTTAAIKTVGEYYLQFLEAKNIIPAEAAVGSDVFKEFARTLGEGRGTIGILKDQIIDNELSIRSAAVSQWRKKNKLPMQPLTFDSTSVQQPVASPVPSVATSPVAKTPPSQTTFMAPPVTPLRASPSSASSSQSLSAAVVPSISVVPSVSGSPVQQAVTDTTKVTDTLRDEANYTNPDVIGTLFLQYLDSNPSSDIRDIHPFQLSTRTATAKARVSYDTFSQKFAPRDNDNRKVRDLLEIHKDAIVSAAKALYEKRAQQAASPQQAQPTGTPSQVVPPQPPVALPPQAQPAVAPVTPSPPVVQQPLVPPVPPPPPPQPPVVQQPIAQQQPQVPQQPQPMQGVQAALGNPAGGSDGSMPTSTFSNPWMTDDTRQLAQLLTTYDENVYKSMLSRLGADQNYRKIHAVPAQNEFRELLYGPPVSGGDIRQMNRILDTSMEPSTRHMELKLIEFRGLVLSIISDLLPHNATPSVGAVGNVEYDAMESQIPLERVDAMEVDSGVRPYEAQPVLRYQDDQDDIMSTLPQSFRYLMRSLSSIGLKDLRVPFMKFFECMTDVVTNNNAARYRELHSKLNEIVSELPRLRFKMGEMHFQKLMMSAGTTRASIESLIYLADKKINAARELQMIDSILKNKRPAETSTESRNRPVENGIKRRRARM